MLDHIGFSTADLDKARDFYAKALAPLGITVLMEVTPDMTGTLLPRGAVSARGPHSS